MDTGSGVRAVIGDVRGKGLPAVRISGRALGVFRAVAYDERDLSRIARRMEQSVLREAGPEDFVTVLLVEATREGRCTLLSFGHPPPLVRTAAGEVRETPIASHPPLGLGLARPPERDRTSPAAGEAAADDGDDPGGPGDARAVASATDPAVDPLAAAPGAAGAPTTELVLAPGDELLLVTDGALEARNAAGEFYPLVPRYAACPGPADDPPVDVLAALGADMRAYSGGALDDDSALVLLRYAPPGDRSSSAGAVPPR